MHVAWSELSQHQEQEKQANHTPAYEIATDNTNWYNTIIFNGLTDLAM